MARIQKGLSSTVGATRRWTRGLFWQWETRALTWDNERFPRSDAGSKTPPHPPRLAKNVSFSEVRVGHKPLLASGCPMPALAHEGKRRARRLRGGARRAKEEGRSLSDCVLLKSSSLRLRGDRNDAIYITEGIILYKEILTNHQGTACSAR